MKVITAWFKIFFKAFPKSVSLFINNNAIRMSAALSFYTFFAIGPVFLILIFTTSWLIGNNMVETNLYNQITNFIGKDAASQVQLIILNSRKVTFSGFTSLITIIALIFSATGVFTEIQSSINSIWQLKVKPKKGWVKYLTNRFISFSVIIGLGFILLVSLVISTIADIFLHKLSNYLSYNTEFYSSFINIVITLLIVSSVFGIIYKFLPDAKVKKQDIFVSSILTSLLFVIGKFFIGYYISASNPGGPYGTAGSIVLILLWVYYSSMILYFGACFTKAYAKLKERDIFPDNYAVFVEQVEVENKKPLLLQKENKKV